MDGIDGQTNAELNRAIALIMDVSAENWAGNIETSLKLFKWFSKVLRFDDFDALMICSSNNGWHVWSLHNDVRDASDCSLTRAIAKSFLINRKGDINGKPNQQRQL